MAKYQVVVGNIGTVYHGSDLPTAVREFESYQELSRIGLGRAGQEPVTLFRDDDIMLEFLPVQEDTEA